MRNSTLTQALPPTDEMLAAFLRRDSEYDGLFFTGVRTTGIFCRTTCSARKPKPENVEFFPSTSQALFAGYRPCLRCRPLEPRGQTPEWLRPLLARIEGDPTARVRDRDLVVLGLDPGRVRRWFRRNHGMTFHAYQRARRLGSALEEIREGRDVTSTAFDHGFDSLSGFNTAFARFAGAAPTRSKECPLIQITRILTPLGPMIAAASEEALHLLEFTDRRMLETQLERLGRRTGAVLAPGSNAVLEQTEKELTEYFDGARTDFTIPLEPAGTDFQRGAWTALGRIPFGDTRSYAQQALAIGRPTAVRAVAKANGDNPIAIVVPCHRVVGSNGKLTGYAGGLHRKQFLLDLERRVAGKETQLSAL
jgi:AraC family transcriptional regulator of adaptative response/methylated-DNA-[protein]-cysteine methyltransferase